MSRSRLVTRLVVLATFAVALGLSPISLFVTRGHLEFEWRHLRRKLSVRDPAWHRSLKVARLRSHPMLRVIAGGIERWEII